MATLFHLNFSSSGRRDFSFHLSREALHPTFPISNLMWTSAQASDDVKANQGQGDAQDTPQTKHPEDTHIYLFPSPVLITCTFAFLFYPIKTPIPGPFAFTRWAHLEASTNFCHGVRKDTSFPCVCSECVLTACGSGRGAGWTGWKKTRPRHIPIWIAYSAPKASRRLFWIVQL